MWLFQLRILIKTLPFQKYVTNPLLCDFRNLSVDSEQWQLSQDIDSAMERYMPLSGSPASDGDGAVSEERFSPARLIDGDIKVDDGRSE